LRVTSRGLGDVYKRQPAIKSNPMNITHASTKADIIDASCEVIDTQAEQINDLKERQLILWTIVGILTVLLAFGA
jgi:hypothetical protein